MKPGHLANRALLSSAATIAVVFVGCYSAGYGGAHGCHTEWSSLVWTQPGVWTGNGTIAAHLPVHDPDPWSAFHAPPSWFSVVWTTDLSFEIMLMQGNGPPTLIVSTGPDMAPRPEASWLVANGTWPNVVARLQQEMGEPGRQHYVASTEVEPGLDSWFTRVQPDLRADRAGLWSATQGNWTLRGSAATMTLEDGRVVDARDRVQAPSDWTTEPISWGPESIAQMQDEVLERVPGTRFAEVGVWVSGGCSDWSTSAYVPADQVHRLPDEVGSLARQ